MGMKWNCCPTCRRRVSLSDLPPLYRQLEPLADGTRTYAELARLVGADYRTVAVVIAHLRRMGVDVRGLDRPLSGTPTPEDYKLISDLRGQGKTWDDIGNHFGGRSGAWAYKKGKALAARFGALPGRVGKDSPRRNLIRERIRELREEAGLPWKRIAEILDMNPHYICQQYHVSRRVSG